MFNIQHEELNWCGRRLTLETGRLARQADGAVLATWGETTVLATVVAAKEPKAGQDSFPSPSTIRRRRSPQDEFLAAISSAKGASPTAKR